MTISEIIWAALGLLMIGVVVCKIRKNGIAEDKASATDLEGPTTDGLTH